MMFWENCLSLTVSEHSHMLINNFSTFSFQNPFFFFFYLSSFTTCLTSHYIILPYTLLKYYNFFFPLPNHTHAGNTNPITPTPATQPQPPNPRWQHKHNHQTHTVNPTPTTSENTTWWCHKTDEEDAEREIFLWGERCERKCLRKEGEEREEKKKRKKNTFTPCEQYSVIISSFVARCTFLRKKKEPDVRLFCEIFSYNKSIPSRCSKIDFWLE